MNLFDVYPLLDVEIVKGRDCYVYDSAGKQYLDLYGGHAVISVGHSHPYYVKAVTEQLNNLGFYSNSVRMPIQAKLASLLGKVSGYDDYSLFMVNSGAESNENAIKLASFHTCKSRVISFSKAFHGRTHGAVTITDNPSIVAPVNHNNHVTFVPLNDDAALDEAMSSGDVCAVIIEGIQGLAGIECPTPEFLETTAALCRKHGIVLILDEIQSGYGRAGKFFAHQYTNIRPDIITVAKGMGNGFPVSGVLISPEFKPKHGLLGTTFGGNPLACAASLAVLEIMQNEGLIENAATVGAYLKGQLSGIPEIKQLRGAGLMLGLDFGQASAGLRNRLIMEHNIFTGSASNKNVIRLLPPLTLTKEYAGIFVAALKKALEKGV